MTFDRLKLMAAGCVLLISGLESVGGEETTIRAASPAKEGFRLSISLPNKEFDVGSPISVSVVTTCVSKTALRNQETDKWHTYYVVLIKDKKKASIDRIGETDIRSFEQAVIREIFIQVSTW